MVASLGREINLNPPLTLGQLPDTAEELMKLDQVFIKSELKVILYCFSYVGSFMQQIF